jgi:DNA-binding response OmpR family regulator
MKILIAEDDRVTAQLLSTRLNQAGHQTVVAFDTMQAMMTCMRSRPDALILDVQMPGGSGLQVLHRLKASRKTAMLPVIVLTAHAEHEQAAMEAGADAFLMKPPDLDRLEEILDRFYVRHGEPERVHVTKSASAMPVPRSRNIVRNIMLVEDDRVVADLVAQALKRAGYATIFAPDIGDALRVLNAFRIDAVVLDMQLPSGSGLDVIQRLRSYSRTGDVPIIVVSGTLDERAAEFALAAGADSFFRKPPDLDAVMARLNAHFHPQLRRRHEDVGHRKPHEVATHA